MRLRATPMQMALLRVGSLEEMKIIPVSFGVPAPLPRAALDGAAYWM